MRKAVIVDLDGTLVNTNTFTRFVIWLFSTLMKRGRLKDAATVAISVARRKLRLIPHSRAKHRIMTVADSALNDKDFTEFAASMVPYLRKNVMNLIEERQKMDDAIIIATAAPAEYAVPLGNILGFYIVASDFHADYSHYHECKGNVKKTAVDKLCRSLDCTVAFVLTDHFHDLPLFEYKDAENILVEPDSKTIESLERNSIKYSILK